MSFSSTFVIFSDGLEYGQGFDFYHDPPKPENFEKIAASLQKEVRCPDLSGVWLYWYFPKTAENSHQIRATRDFWKSLLEKKGANIIEMEY